MNKIFFLHIPKTGGTSINDTIVKAIGEEKSVGHAENSCNPKIHFSDKLFISGHIPYPRVRKSVKMNGYIPVTIIRNPFDHIVSHISWVRNLKSNNKIHSAPKKIKKLCDYLNNINYSDEKHLKCLADKIFKNYYEVFDNRQIRYLTDTSDNRRLEKLDLNNALQISCDFEHIGNFDDLQKTNNFILDQLTYRNRNRTFTLKDLNSANKKIELTDYTKDIFKELFNDFIIYDKILFEKIHG